MNANERKLKIRAAHYRRERAKAWLRELRRRQRHEELDTDDGRRADLYARRQDAREAQEQLRRQRRAA